jgi:hypothetical protein
MKLEKRLPAMRHLLLAAVAAATTFVIAAPAAGQTIEPPQRSVFLYVDTVNGTRPVGAKPRPIGCTQTNYFQRGEQVVFRIYGTEASTGAILSTENVKYAYVKIPGLANLRLNWGAHGAPANRVWFWTAAWIVPKSYPLGAVNARIVFKTEENKFGVYDYELHISPTLSRSK